MSIGWMFAALFACCAGVDGPGLEQQRALRELPVALTTADGVEISGGYYAPAKRTIPKSGKSPAAILIHMYPANRQSWAPLIQYLHHAGVAVLTYDIRGNGGSAKDSALATRYRDRDSSLFQSAWQDAAAAAKWLAARPEIDAEHLACIGASIGCSISIDYCTRDPNIRAVVCLSPGANYFNVDTRAHLKKCGGRPILLLAPEAERSSPEELAALAQNVSIDIRPGGRDQHGTNLFLNANGESVAQRIVEFISQPLGLPTDAWPAIASAVSEQARWRTKIEPVVITIGKVGPYGYAIRRYQEDVGSIPPTLKALYEPPQDPAPAAKWKGPYLLHEISPDIWGRPYRYAPGAEARHNKDSFDLWSAGPDGKDGTDDDIGNWDFD